MFDKSSMQRTNSAIKGSERIRDEEKLVIYVESKTDVVFYKRIFNFKEENVVFQDAEGWEKVNELVESGTDNKDKRIGIIDADFTHITNKGRTSSSRIFLTDTHDVETLVMFLIEQKLIDLQLVSQEVITKSKEIAKQIGILRFINNKDGNDKFGLRFFDKACDKRLPYYDKNSDLYKGKVFDAVINFNTSIPDFLNNGHKKKEQIHSEYTQELNNKFDDFQIINGHDLVPILSKLISDKTKYYKFDSKTEREFFRHLFSQVDSSDFQQTALYNNIHNHYSKIFP